MTDYVRTRMLAAYAKHYTIAWPCRADRPVQLRQGPPDRPRRCQGAEPDRCGERGPGARKPDLHITTGTGFATHDFVWISRNLSGDAKLSDITSAMAVLSLMGPKAWQILSHHSPDDLSNAGFPFGTAG